MNITRVVLEKFKKVDRVDIEMRPVNVLVGANNAGKSSVLQGIHFSVIAAIARRIARQDTFTQESLLYCPSGGFESLRHGGQYLNQSNFGFLKLTGQEADEELEHCDIKIYRGRNQGNIGCQRSGSYRLGGMVSSADRLFSVYVPGLAGVSQHEQQRTESVVRRGVASGDANLYLRNVLLLIEQKRKRADLEQLMRSVFPKFSLQIAFDPVSDIYIDVQVSTTGASGRHCPLELAGTGVLQALQIFSYVTLFEPRLLLLDEPDAHLHPDNQVLLANALTEAAASTKTQMIVSTHSRHLVDALHEEANLVWLKDGRVIEQGIGLPRIPVMLDLGALGEFDKLAGGSVDLVVISEDSDYRMLEVLLEKEGADLARCMMLSYRTSSNLSSAILLAQMIKEVAPLTHVLIHRDRDFMTDSEVAKVERRIEEVGALAFLTDGSDIEAYFATASHIACCLEVREADVGSWMDELAAEEHNELQHWFTRKRDEIKYALYKGSLEDAPDTLALLGNTHPLRIEHRLGKAMLKLVRGRMRARFGRVVELSTQSPFLSAPRLRSVLTLT
jgi:predicted ATPase